MPSSNTCYSQTVSHSRGQKRIDLRAALEASPTPQINQQLTFGELARAYLATHISPTHSQHRYPEPIRRVSLSEKEVNRPLDGAAAYKDRRFAVLIKILIETGARRGEVCERRWPDIDLESDCIEVLETKTGTPRMLFISQDTVALMKRVRPVREPHTLLFESSQEELG